MSAIRGAWAGAEAPGGGGREWPASFLTGKLGSNNILPTGEGALLGAMFGGDGYTTTQQRSQIVARQTAMATAGRANSGKYDFIHSQYAGDGTWGGVYGCEDPENTAGAAPGGVTHEEYALANGSECVITWGLGFSIGDINAGSADTIATKLGTYWASLAPQRIMCRLMHEFDGFFMWSVNGSGGPYSGPQFVSAFRRIVDRIVAAGATNVGFWWCPNEYLGTLSRTQMNAYYPGDSYVDWVGSDIYNHNTGQSTPLHTLWAEWWELFNYGQDWASGYCHYDIYSRSAGDPLRASSGSKGFTGTTYTKPFVVGETGTPYDSGGSTTKKANWFRNIVDLAKAMPAMPNLVGVSFYDREVANNPAYSDFDWRVGSNASVADVVGTDPDATTFAGFTEMSADPLFAGR